MIWMLFACLLQAQDMEALAAKGDTKAMVTLGIRAASSGDNAGATHWWMTAAEAGDPWGFLNVGVHFREGIGVDQDLVFACNLMRAANEITRSGDEAKAASDLLQKSRELMTEDQRARCDAATLKGLTLARVQKHKSGPQDRFQTNDAWAGALKAIGGVRSSEAQTTKPKIASRQYGVSLTRTGDILRSDLSDEDAAAWVNGTTIFAGDLAVGVPPLGTGAVQLNLGHLESKDDFLAVFLSDGDDWPSSPPADGSERAVMMLLPTQVSQESARKVLVDSGRLREVYADQLSVGSDQVIVLNERPGPLFPMTRAMVSGERSRVHHIGITRVAASAKGRVYQLGMVLATQSDDLPAEILAAIGRMDAFAKSIQPRGTASE